MSGDDSEVSDLEYRVDVEALMEEVRARADRRRASGIYDDEMREPALVELALYDDLAASTNRLQAAARLPGLVPALSPVPPGGGVDEEKPGEEGSPEITHGAIDRAMAMARRVLRKAIGDRLDNFMTGVAEFVTESSYNSRIATERIISLERRIAELEEEIRKV